MIQFVLLMGIMMTVAISLLFMAIQARYAINLKHGIVLAFAQFFFLTIRFRYYVSFWHRNNGHCMHAMARAGVVFVRRRGDCLDQLEFSEVVPTSGCHVLLIVWLKAVKASMSGVKQ